MRLRLPHLRGQSPHSYQASGLMFLAGLAMATAPLTPVETLTLEPEALPTLAPVLAEPRPIGPLTRDIVFNQPVPGHAVNSEFGMRRLGGQPGQRMHKGVDIAAPQGTPVLAVAEGRVLRTGNQPSGYGRFVELRHPNGMTSLYAHLSRTDVRTGQTITAEQQIGQVGSTGFSTGPHLHLEIKRNGTQVNPARVIGTRHQVRLG